MFYKKRSNLYALQQVKKSSPETVPETLLTLYHHYDWPTLIKYEHIYITSLYIVLLHSANFTCPIYMWFCILAMGQWRRVCATSPVAPHLGQVKSRRIGQMTTPLLSFSTWVE